MRVSPLSHPGLFVLSIPPDLLYLLPSVAVIEQHNQANVERKGLVCLMGFSLQRTVESQGTQGETRELACSACFLVFPMTTGWGGTTQSGLGLLPTVCYS